MKYYTYIHATPEGEVFYVGKGIGSRVYSMSDRTLKWREVVQKHDGIIMKVVSRFATEKEAFDHEIMLIDKYKKEGCNLVNLTAGGRGPLDYCSSEKTRKLKSQQMTGYRHKQVICPHCKTSGGVTSMKRWHFSNCTGAHPTHKSRTTLFGRRVYLGKYHTKNEADNASKEFYNFVMQETAALNRQVWVVV